MDNQKVRKELRRVIIALTAVVIVIIAAGGYFYKVQERQYLRQVEANLMAIGRLKADQIAKWRAERIGDAMVTMDRAGLIRDIEDFLMTPTEAIKEKILKKFETFRRCYHYADVLLVDPDGKVRLNLNGHCEFDRLR
ncbi:MAG: hypothetical protein AB1724_19700 [Thermodesulfobacteriota bacterium]